MSLILDALRRAEQERQQGRAPGLDQLPTGPASTRRSVPWPTLAVASLVVAGAVALGLTLRHGEAEAPQAPISREARPLVTATTAAQASAAQPAQATAPAPAAVKPANAHAKPALQGARDLNSMDDLLEPPAPVRAAATQRSAPPRVPSRRWICLGRHPLRPCTAKAKREHRQRSPRNRLGTLQTHRCWPLKMC